MFEEIEPQLAEYGYTQNANKQIVTPAGKVTQVKIVRKHRRFEATSVVNPDVLIWAGPKISVFLEKFWYARPIK